MLGLGKCSVGKSACCTTVRTPVEITSVYINNNYKTSKKAWRLVEMAQHRKEPASPRVCV